MGISLELATDRQYAALRRRFLKDAGKYYSKEAWSDSHARVMAGVGVGLGVGGTALYYAFDSQWCAFPALVGLVNIGQAYMRKRQVTDDCVSALDKRTAGVSCEELERRIRDCDYSVPSPSEADVHDAQMEVYAIRVMQSVAENEFGIARYPWSAAGVTVAGVGIYKSFDDPAVGGLTLALGSALYLAAHMIKRRKLAKIGRVTIDFLREKGYGYFDSYVKKKDPYHFYQYKLKDPEDSG